MTVVLYSRTLCVLVGIVLFGSLVHGAEPPVQPLPCMWDFSTWEATSTNYPPGMIGWTLASAASTQFILTPALSDAPLSAPSSASTTAGGVHNYAGKLGILDTGSGAFALACAISTLARSNIVVTCDVMTLRNPYDGTKNIRINAFALLYRVGTSGSFTCSGLAYTNDTTQQKTGTVPQNPLTLTVQLPPSCDNQAVVQLRWSACDLSGSGSRPSFAIGRIQVSGDGSPSLLTPPQNIRATAVNATSFTLTWDVVPHATAYALDLYACTETLGEGFFDEDFNGFSGSSNVSREDVLDDYTQTSGWTGRAVYESAGAIRLGNSSTRGWIETPLLNVSGRWSAYFDAGAWDNPSEATTIDVYTLQNGTTNLLETLTLSKTTLQPFVIQTETTGGCHLGFTAKRNTNNRFYLDNLSLFRGWQTQTAVTNNMTVTANQALLTGLRPGLRYQGVIRALNETGHSPDSDFFSVKTFNATLILLN
jgi:hypothetical protein